MESTNRRKDTGPSPVNPGNPSWELFDGQAPIFERRAGLPVQCCRDIAEAISEAGDVRSGDLIVEIGPGTGQVGQWLAKSTRYAGLDLSAGMLQEFHHRLVPGSGTYVLIRADCNQSWPLGAGSARVVFSSRAMHLLDHEHVAQELFRIASGDGATLVLGRVERTSDSVRTRMAHEMIERLRRHGFLGRRGERQNQKLIESCCQRGAQRLPLIPVASWKVSTNPRQSLDSWRCLKGLGGIPVPTETRDEVLNELAAWANEQFGALDRESESIETYVLTPLRLPASV